MSYFLEIIKVIMTNKTPATIPVIAIGLNILFCLTLPPVSALFVRLSKMILLTIYVTIEATKMTAKPKRKTKYKNPKATINSLPSNSQLIPENVVVTACDIDFAAVCQMQYEFLHERRFDPLNLLEINDYRIANPEELVRIKYYLKIF